MSSLALTSIKQHFWDGKLPPQAGSLLDSILAPGSGKTSCKDQILAGAFWWLFMYREAAEGVGGNDS
jgi:hypothetical protein